MPATYYNATFRFYAYAGTTTRIRPEDMGLGDYYFGVRYREPVSSGGAGLNWWYKTSSQTLDYEQNETHAQAITLDFTLLGDQFVDAPAGIGTALWELVICDEARPTWSTSQPNEVLKLPNFTIDGVEYVNSGSMDISNWINASVIVMSFPSSGYSYSASTINTSDTSWVIDSHPAWIQHNVYRGASEVTGANPYINGDSLRLVPTGTNTGADRYGTVVLKTVTGDASKEIDVYQTGTSPHLTFNDYDGYGLTFSSSSYGVLTVGGTSQLARWATTSGLGSTLRTVWVRLWNTTDSTGTAWVELSAKDNWWMNTWTTTASSFVANGDNISFDVATSDPTA